MFVVLTYTSDLIVYFVTALRDALSKIYTLWYIVVDIVIVYNI